MIRNPFERKPYYDWGLDRWKIGGALVLFGFLLFWSANGLDTRLPEPTPLPGAITLTRPAAGIVEAGTPQLLAGTAPPGSQVTVLRGGSEMLGTAIAGADGRWLVETGGIWAEADYLLHVGAVDAAGNLLGESAPVRVLGVVMPVLAPELVPAQVGDGILQGRAAPAITVEVYRVDAGARMLLGTTQADNTGRWQLEPVTLVDPDLQLILVAKDPLSRILAESGVLSLAGVPVAERAATAEAGGVANGSAGGTPPPDSLTGLEQLPTLPLTLSHIAPNGRLSVSRAQVLEGTAAAWATVLVSDRAGPADTETLLGGAEVDGSGRWRLVLPAPLTLGEHQVTVRQLSMEGVDERMVGPIPFSVVASAEPTAQQSLSISYPTVGAHLFEPLPLLSGTGLPAIQVRVRLTDVAGRRAELYTLVNNNGRWQVQPEVALRAGGYTVEVAALDPAGQIAALSAPVAFAVLGAEAAAPLGPSGFEPALQKSVDLRGNTPIFSGQAPAAAMVRIAIFTGEGQGESHLLRVDEEGLWRLAVISPLPTGLVTVTAQAVDEQGRGQGEPGYLVVEVTAEPSTTPVPALPDRIQLTTPAPGRQFNRLPPISGAAVPGSTVVIQMDGTTVATAIADRVGYWYALPATPLEAGMHSLRIVSSSGESLGPLRLEVGADTPTVPAPVILSPAAHNILESSRPLIRGVAQPGAQVLLFADGSWVGSTMANSHGDWGLMVERSLGVGSVGLMAKIVGADGQELARSTRVLVQSVDIPRG